MSPARKRSEHLHEVCTVIGNQIRLIQTMVSYIFNVWSCGCLVIWVRKGDINPSGRARNSRLGESQGRPLDHSLSFFSLSLSLPFSLSFSLSFSLQQSPIILGIFYDIQSLPRNFRKRYIHLTEMFNSKIILNSHFNYLLFISIKDTLVYKHALT